MANGNSLSFCNNKIMTRLAKTTSGLFDQMETWAVKDID